MSGEQYERLIRPSVPEMDEILGQPFPVLDDGCIRVIDYMGNDAAIVQAARVSYGAGTKKVSDDRGLIRYLMRHRHTTPFEMAELKLHVKVPMDAWRQWIRHRTASVNEISSRYSVVTNHAQVTSPEDWRIQSSNNKQGSDGFLDDVVGRALSREEQELHDHARKVYDHRIEQGVAREQARKDLPLSTYTEAYWKIDLHNLLHFLSLRMDSHAQKEIRDYANIIGNEIVSRWVPFTWEAFQDYRMDSLSLTRLDTEIVTALSKGSPDEARTLAESYGWLKKRKDGNLVNNRERAELEAKLERLGLEKPW